MLSGMTMHKILMAVVGLLLLTSCAEKHEGELKSGLFSRFVSITDNEDNGVKKILNFYGGYCKYAIGASASTEDGKKKYFELELSRSHVLEKQRTNPELIAANIAYLFFSNLKEERKNYDELHTVLIFADGKKETFEFPIEQLQLVENRMAVVNKIVAFIKDKNFEALRPMLVENGLFPYDKNQLIANLKTVDPQFGNVTEGFRPFGFRINKTKYGAEIVHIAGAVIRDKQSNAFSVDLNLNGKDDKAYKLEYEL